MFSDVAARSVTGVASADGVSPKAILGSASKPTAAEAIADALRKVRRSVDTDDFLDGVCIAAILGRT
jgi:predicted RNase H-like nuclease